MLKTTIGKLKKGDLFYLRYAEPYTVYVRDHYDRSTKMYAYHKYYDLNSEYFAKRDKVVFI